MRTLIIDIKTIGEEWDAIDGVTQALLQKSIDDHAYAPEAWMHEFDKLQHGLSFSPLTGSVIALGLYDVERAKGAVYFVPNANEQYACEGKVDTYRCKARSEALLLSEFWEGAKEYDTFVTFNGRAFGMPFLLHRSVAHGIRPTRELMKYRYLSHQSVPFHIDLMDEFTFYGATRRQALYLFCRTFGIESYGGIDMNDVAIGELYRAGRVPHILRQVTRDVSATAELYKKWREYLAPMSFLDTVEIA
jgi:DNA polymerase elongation subunit (family B)